MRLVLFTTLPAIRQTEWWSAIVGAAGLDEVLICQQTSPRDTRSHLQRVVRLLRTRHPIRRASRVLTALLRSRQPHAYGQMTSPASDSHLRVTEMETYDVHDESSIAALKAFDADVGVSIGAPILRRSVYALPKHGTINVHLGYAPRYRGAPPGFWELIEGAPTIGATIHFVDDGIDSGPIIRRADAPIVHDDDLGTVELRAFHLALGLLAETLPHALSGNVESTKQESGNTYRLPGVVTYLSCLMRVRGRRLVRSLRHGGRTG